VHKSDKKCIKVTKNENMIKVVVIDRNDNRHELDAPTDMNMNMMELCRSYELPVEGTCGGMAMCASCHMYVLSSHKIGDRSDDEEDMLDEAFFVEDSSRLGCQIKLRDSLDGIEIKLAPVG